MSETVNRIMEKYGLKDKEPPKKMPVIQEELKYLKNYQSVSHKGFSYFWIPDKRKEKGGYYLSEWDLNKIFFRKQIEVIDKKMANVDTEIQRYESDIDKIETYLGGKKAEAMEHEVAQIARRDKIRAAKRKFDSIKKAGALKVDPIYKLAEKAYLDALNSDPQKSYVDSEQYHKVMWNDLIENSKKYVDLHSLKARYKARIATIKAKKREPLEEQRELNEDHLQYWTWYADKVNGK